MSIKTCIRVFILIVFIVFISDMFASSKKIRALESKLEISTTNESVLLNQFDSYRFQSFLKGSPLQNSFAC